jgi:hypothetical protein
LYSISSPPLRYKILLDFILIYYYLSITIFVIYLTKIVTYVTKIVTFNKGGFVMAEIKSMTAIRDKWTRVTPMRTEDYKIGVQNPKRDWADATEAQEDVWKMAITEAAAKGMFGKGVRSAGTNKWREGALTKGPGRFAEGVMVAGPDYEKGFRPYAEVIAATDLPPRFPKGDPRNIQRVSVLATALRKKKMEG